MAAPHRPIERIVAELDARAQIHDAIMRYCRGMDHRDAALALSAYHADAWDDHGFFRGPAADFVKAGVDGSAHLEVIRHVICNEYVELAEDNENLAFSETVTIGCLLTRAGDEYRLAISSCRFLDRFERRDSAWKIADRKVVLDWEREEIVRGLAGGTFTAGMLRGFAGREDPSFALGFRTWGDVPLPPAREERVEAAVERLEAAL